MGFRAENHPIIFVFTKLDLVHEHVRDQYFKKMKALVGETFKGISDDQIEEINGKRAIEDQMLGVSNPQLNIFLSKVSKYMEKAFAFELRRRQFKAESDPQQRREYISYLIETAKDLSIFCSFIIYAYLETVDQTGYCTNLQCWQKCPCPQHGDEKSFKTSSDRLLELPAIDSPDHTKSRSAKIK